MSQLIGLPSDSIKGSVLDKYGPIMTILALFFIVQFILLILYQVKPIRPFVSKLFKNQKKKLFWSGSIKGMVLEYIMLATPAMVNMKKLLYGYSLGRNRMIIEVSVIVPSVVFFPFFLIYLIHKNKRKISTNDIEFMCKYEALT
jgi:hypothetical protein